MSFLSLASQLETETETDDMVIEEKEPLLPDHVRSTLGKDEGHGSDGDHHSGLASGCLLLDRIKI